MANRLTFRSMTWGLLDDEKYGIDVDDPWLAGLGVDPFNFLTLAGMHLHADPRAR